MIHQTASSPHGEGGVGRILLSKRRKRKRHFYQTDNPAGSPTSPPSSTAASAVTSEAPAREGDNSSCSQPKKRRRKKKNKKPEEGTKEGIKPVLVAKKPEDYSANWKMLKDIITKDDKKEYPKKPFRREGKKSTTEKTRKDFKTGKKPQKKKVEVQPDKEEAKEEEEEEEEDIWFDNVDPILIEKTKVKKEKKPDKPASVKKPGKPAAVSLVKEESPDSVTKAVAMDCEMVGVGMNGKDSILARVSIVNHYGKVLYDKYVKPMEEVVDYRTPISGIRPADLVNGCEFSVVQKEVAELLEGRILVGHSVHNDLRCLFLSHPRSHIRDTSRYRVFKHQFGGRTPSLKKLVERLLGVRIQEGEHSSVQDAQATMRIYTMHRKDWERSRQNKYRVNAKRATAASAKREQLASQKAEDESV